MPLPASSTANRIRACSASSRIRCAICPASASEIRRGRSLSAERTDGAASAAVRPVASTDWTTTRTSVLPGGQSHGKWRSTVPSAATLVRRVRLLMRRSPFDTLQCMKQCNHAPQRLNSVRVTPVGSRLTLSYRFLLLQVDDSLENRKPLRFQRNPADRNNWANLPPSLGPDCKVLQSQSA